MTAPEVPCCRLGVARGMNDAITREQMYSTTFVDTIRQALFFLSFLFVLKRERGPVHLSGFYPQTPSNRQ